MATLTQILLNAMQGGDTELPDSALTDQIPTGKIFEAAPPKAVPSLPEGLQNYFIDQFERIRSGEITEPGYTQDELIKSLEGARNRELQSGEIPTLEDPVHGYNVLDQMLRFAGDPTLSPINMADPGTLSRVKLPLAGALLAGSALYSPPLGGTTLTAPGSTYDPALGSDSPVPDIPGFTEGLRPALKGILPEGDLTGADVSAVPSIAPRVGDPEAAARASQGWNIIPAGYNPALEQATTVGYLNPEEFGLDPFTNEQIREARATYLRLMGKPSPTYGAEPVDLSSLPSHLLQKDAAEVLADIPGGNIYQVLQQHFDEAEAERISLKDVTGAYEVASAGDYIPMIDNTTVAPATFIGDKTFVPSFAEGGYTIAPSGPVVGEEAQPMAQAVTQALANTGQPVQQNLQALAALAQTDPSIAKRYVAGSQALQDITTQVESFSEPTVEWTPPKKKEVKKVKGPTKKQKAATRRANQAANKKLLAEKKEARDIQKAKNAEIRAEKLAARESAKQARERKSAEQALAVQRRHEKMAREQELKRFEKQLRNAAEESRAAYLARKKQEDELREVQGYGWGDIST